MKEIKRNPDWTDAFVAPDAVIGDGCTLGFGVVIEAEHHCMTTRGVNKQGVSMTTSTLLGSFRENPETRREFQRLIGR